MNDNEPTAPVKQTNTMGLVGFIISLVSLVGCGGLLSPVSLIFSLIGLGKEPKGFAIAGLVLSFIGLSGFIIFFFFLSGLTILLTLIGLAAAALVVAVGQNAFVVVDAINDFHDDHGVIPASLDELDLQPNQITDTWGNDFVYVPAPDGQTFMLISAGPDGTLGNDDDLLGEIDLGDGFDLEVHHGYDGVSRSRWGGGLPAAPAPAAPADLPELPEGTGASDPL